MRSRPALPILLLWLALLSSVVAIAQSTPTTGLPPFVSTAGGPFDVINLANLNAHYSIPVFSRPGKGVSFSYALNYDSLVWQVTQDSGGALHWSPMPNWGWSGSTQPTTGYVTYTYSDVIVVCSGNNVEKETWTNFVYYDPLGVPHRFGGSVYLYDDPGCGSSHPSMTAQTGDNSGYTMQLGPVTTGEMNVPTTVTAAGGIKFSPPSLSSSGSGTVQDTNGNTISVVSSGTATFTDTLGTTALTVSGSAPNPVTYKYTAPQPTQASVTVNYSSYTVQTNFNIWADPTHHIGEYNQLVNLVSSITLPDGSTYSFTYEKTNGSGNNVTGRIASVTLPTGGTITYSYSGPCSNVYNCMMSDGSPSNMSRTLGGGTWSYTRSLQSGQQLPQTTTQIIDPDNNEADLNFSGIYETSRKVYQGSSSGTLLDFVSKCYNSGSYPCDTAVVTPPISRLNTIDHRNDANVYHYNWSHDSYYNSYGLLTLGADYDFVNSSLVPARVTTINYNTALYSYNIYDRPLNVQITDGSTSKAYTTYVYDEGGNTLGSVTSVNRSSSGSTGGPFLSQHYSYNTSGTVATATDVNGTVTTYSYTGSSCNSAFPTSVTTASLTTAYAYNCTGGVSTSVTDPNGAITSTSYSDAYFWRPASTTDPLSNVTTFSYLSPTQSESVMTFNGGLSMIDQTVQLDSLGRAWLTQRYSPNSNTWDSVFIGYDSSGRIAWQTQPYAESTKWHGTVGARTKWTYDALARPLLVTEPDNVGTTAYSYNLNDVLVTVSGQPSGENTKRKQYQYNTLGLVKSVCELTSAGGSSACSQNTGATGYFTGYSWDPLGDLTTVSQSGQTRTMTYDGLGRMIAEIAPEVSSAATHYYYDSDTSGHCTGTYNGDKVARVDPAGRASCYQYDGLHRLTLVSYPGSGMPNKYFIYDASSWAGLTLTKPKGRLIAAYTQLSGQNVALEGFGYDARGQVTDYYQWSQNSSGWYHVQQSYTASGARSTLQAFLNNGNPLTHQFWYDTNEGEGRYQGLVDVTNSNQLVSCCTHYNAAAQPNQVQMIGSYDIFSYDSNTGRMTQWQSEDTYNHSQTGTLTWNANGTLKQMAITDGFNSSNTQTCTFGHDDVARLSSVDCGSGNWGQGFSYDPYGNITKSVPTGYNGISFNPGYNSGNNRANGFNYDGVGDLKLDASYAYDLEGRPVTANGVQIIYDALNRAVELNSGSSHQQILYDAQGAKLAYMSAQTVQKYMLPLANGVQAVFNSSGISYYRHADWLGSSRLALKTDGSVYADQAYAPFGETYAETSTTDRSFTGQTQDTTAGSQGVYDFLLRQQASNQGRWLAPDPAGLAAVDITNPQTWNRYAYVGNNPLSNTDALGLTISDECGGMPCGWPGVPPFLPPGDGPDGSFCGYICMSPPILPPLPIPVRGGGGGGGGGHPSGGGTPPSNPPGGGAGGGTVTWPNETNGIPNGLNVNFGGPLGAIIPSATCGDLGPCPTIGDGFQAQAAVLPWAAPCWSNPVCATAMVIGTVAIAGYEGYQYFSKGRTQNVAHDYVRDMARAMPGDYCSNLKTIMDNARKSGNTKLFNDAKATWKQDCRGK